MLKVRYPVKRLAFLGVDVSSPFDADRTQSIEWPGEGLSERLAALHHLALGHPGRQQAL
jgi:hypothetical protein